VAATALLIKIPGSATDANSCHTKVSATAKATCVLKGDSHVSSDDVTYIQDPQQSVTSYERFMVSASAGSTQYLWSLFVEMLSKAVEQGFSEHVEDDNDSELRPALTRASDSSQASFAL
jgi:hypothetical protein